MQHKEPKLRKSTIADSEFLIQLRNDPVALSQSLNSQPVSLAEHEEWLESTLEDTDRQLYVAEVDGVAIGTCRADLMDGRWRLSWNISSGERKKGYGQQMVNRLVDLHSPCLAEITKANVGSIKIAKEAGLTLLREDGDLLIFYS